MATRRLMALALGAALTAGPALGDAAPTAAQERGWSGSSKHGYNGNSGQYLRISHDTLVAGRPGPLPELSSVAGDG